MGKLHSVADQIKWMNSLNKRMSSAAMIVENARGEVLIVKAGYKEHWTFPGGVIDPDETPRQAACRETLEEVGIVVDESKVEFVAVIDRKSTTAETYQFVFRSTRPFGVLDNIILQASEIDDYEFVSREEVLSGNRNYGKVIYHWVHHRNGYIEQTFGE